MSSLSLTPFFQFVKGLTLIIMITYLLRLFFFLWRKGWRLFFTLMWTNFRGEGGGDRRLVQKTNFSHFLILKAPLTTRMKMKMTTMMTMINDAAHHCLVLECISLGSSSAHSLVAYQENTMNITTWHYHPPPTPLPEPSPSPRHT